MFFLFEKFVQELLSKSVHLEAMASFVTIYTSGTMVSTQYIDGFVHDCSNSER